MNNSILETSDSFSPHSVRVWDFQLLFTAEFAGRGGSLNGLEQSVAKKWNSSFEENKCTYHREILAIPGHLIAMFWGHYCTSDRIFSSRAPEFDSLSKLNNFSRLSHSKSTKSCHLPWKNSTTEHKSLVLFHLHVCSSNRVKYSLNSSASVGRGH